MRIYWDGADLERFGFDTTSKPRLERGVRFKRVESSNIPDRLALRDRRVDPTPG